MKYKLLSWQQNGNLIRHDEETSKQPIIVKVGIEGDIYGFLAPDNYKNSFSVNVPNKLLDINQIMEFITQKAEEFVKETYPDTN